MVEKQKTIVVEQIGSPIRRPGKQRATLIGLGLNKMHKRRILEDTPQVRGMVAKVSHLVRIVEDRIIPIDGVESVWRRVGVTQLLDLSGRLNLHEGLHLASYVGRRSEWNFGLFHQLQQVSLNPMSTDISPMQVGW